MDVDVRHQFASVIIMQACQSSRLELFQSSSDHVKSACLRQHDLVLDKCVSIVEYVHKCAKPKEGP